MSSTGDASRDAVPPSPSGGLTAPVSGFVFPSPCLSSRLGSPASNLIWHDNLSYSPAGMAVNPVTGLRVLLEQGPPRHRAVAPSPPHPPRAPPGPPLAPHPSPAPVAVSVAHGCPPHASPVPPLALNPASAPVPVPVASAASPANLSATDSAMLQYCLARIARLEAALAGLDGVVAPLPAAVAQLQRTMPAIWAMRADLDRVESWLSGVPMPQAPHAVPS